jgi:hypothetical protein
LYGRNISQLLCKGCAKAIKCPTGVGFSLFPPDIPQVVNIWDYEFQLVKNTFVEHGNFSRARRRVPKHPDHKKVSEWDQQQKGAPNS